jgi:nucleolar MIF4G domain-containing protein 1
MVSEKKRSRLRHKNGPKTKSMSKFDEFLEMEIGRGAPTAEEDLELERRLAKKLKVKKGKLTGPDDGINSLFEGFFSDLDPDDDMKYEPGEDLSMTVESPVPEKKKKQKRKHSKLQIEEGNTADEGGSEAQKKRKKKSKDSKPQIEDGNTAEEASTSEAGKKKKLKKKKVVEKETAEDDESAQVNETSEDNPAVSLSVKAKYVPPHLRATASAESEEIAQTRRRVRGLCLNFLLQLFSYHI